MTPADALATLRASRDDQPALIWHDNGQRIAALARTAGVTVTYARVDLAAGTTTYHTVDGRDTTE